MKSFIQAHGKYPAQLIEDMAIYVNSGVVNKGLASAAQSVDARVLRGVCIAILSWLRSRARMPRMVTMDPHRAGSSESALLRLIETDAMFSSVFIVRDNKIWLSDGVNLSEAEEIVTLASKLFNPPRFVTLRREES